MRRTLVLVAGLAVAVAPLAACGDDSDDAAVKADDSSEYCELATQMDQQDSFPTAEQIQALQDAAPDEIKDALDAAGPVLREYIEKGDPAGGFEDPVVQENIPTIDAYEADTCGIDKGEDEPEQDPSVTVADPAAAQVAVTATEYAFTLSPETVAAGRTTFTMTNQGQERHLMALARIADGHTFQEALASEGEEGIDGPQLESKTAAPGEQAVLTADLEPGTYGMICYLPAPDGQPHLAKGMVKEITVA
jgi:uncharacterized cupredoxin-like copper-binding protein